MTSPHLRSGLWFAAVGVAASLTHFGVYLALRHGLPPTASSSHSPQPFWHAPEVLNAAAFTVAFGVSFAGHRWLSFPDSRERVLTSLLRFIPTSLAGFLTNELVFSLLIRAFHMPDRWALVCGMAVAAAQTYVLSRFWAFKR